MSDEIKKYLLDILISINSIDDYLGQPKSFTLYQSNKLIRRAVEREIEIIGEAMNRILKASPEIPISYSRVIVDLRNKVIHAYDNLNQPMIWKIIIKDLPVLKQEVSQLLES